MAEAPKPPPGVPGYPGERTTYDRDTRREVTEPTHVPPARSRPLGAGGKPAAKGAAPNTAKTASKQKPGKKA